MQRILQPIVGYERISNGHVTTWLEQLACGHTGQSRRSVAVIQQAIDTGKRRACFRCNHNRCGKEIL
jgi:hypothetical protein